MKSPSNFQVLPTLRLYVSAACLILVCVGLVVLAGWIFDIDFLKSVFPNAATMKFNTALCFLFTGLSLWFLQNEESPPNRERTGQIIAGIVAVISILTLSEYLFKWDLGIDQLFIKDLATSPASFPGRMSEVTAISFILSGLALLQVNTRASQYFSLTVVVLSLLALIGYLFDYGALYRLAGYGSVALHTALMFFILSLASLAARPSLGIMKTITLDLEGSRLMRCLLPSMVLLTIFLGWMVKVGKQLGWLDVQNDGTVLIVLILVVYSPLIYMYGNQINRAEEQVNRLNRLYTTLSQVNQSIVHVRDRETLYQTICDVIVQFGKFRLAWIGILDVPTGDVHPVALQGQGTELIRSLQMNINHAPFDQGLVGRAFHSGKISTSDDVQTDETMIHWREQSRENGFRSVAVIPFRFAGQTIGVLSLFASEAHFLQRQEELSLLEEIGGDISFALETLQAEEAKSYLASIVESFE